MQWIVPVADGIVFYLPLLYLVPLFVILNYPRALRDGYEWMIVVDDE